MLQGWVVIAVALGYIGLLFVVASYGDRVRQLGRDGRSRLLIYPLSLAIYCTSWTFFGSVGLASRTGFDFLTIYIGPILMFGLLLAADHAHRAARQGAEHHLDRRLHRRALRQAQAVAATVALIAIIGTIPYIALQLKAVSSSLGTILAQCRDAIPATRSRCSATSRCSSPSSMAAFAVLFGTRHIDATEHQDGLMLAIATESIVKLVAFLAVGIFVTFFMFDGPAALFSQAMKQADTAAVLTREPQIGTLVAMTLLSFFAIVLLPRQFHVTVVENNSESEIRRAAWLFPLYLVLINLFVVPIAVAGLLTFPAGKVDSDMFVLALPLSAGSELFTLLAFIGGLSAATAMVIVESVALAIMVSNDLVVPLVLKRREAPAHRARGRRRAAADGAPGRDLRHPVPRLSLLPLGRRGAARLDRPPVLRRGGAARAGLLRRPDLAARHRARRDRRNDRSASWSGPIRCCCRIFADIGIIGRHILTDGPWRACGAAAAGAVRARSAAARARRGLVASRSTSSPMSASRSAAAPASIERLQADLFVPSSLAPMAPSFRLWRSSVTVEELTTTVARYLGEERTRTSFESFASARAHQPRSAGRSRLPAAALRRASARLGDRRRLLAARAVAAAAQAHGLDQGRAQAARRRQCGDPLQPRNPADRARPCAAGHRRVRQGPAAGLLEPAVRRNPRPAAGAHRASASGSRRSCASTPSAARSARARSTTLVRERIGRYVAGSRAVPRALRRPRPRHRGAREPHAGRRHRHDLHRHHAERRGGRGARARQ